MLVSLKHVLCYTLLIIYGEILFMIGINFLINKQGVLKSTKKKIDEIKNNKNDFVSDYYDFDNSNFEDLIEYIDFMDFDEYIFVLINNDVTRMDNLTSYLSKEIGIPISYMSEKIFLEKYNISTTSLTKYDSDFLEENAEHILSNGYLAFKTGIYPLNIPNGLLKHINIKNSNYNILDNVKSHLAINHAIYLNENEPIIKDSFPFLILEDNNFSQLEKKINYISSDKLINSIEKFKTNGKIDLPYSLIRDYGSIVGLSKLNSLYIYNNNYYLDSKYGKLIGSSEDTFENILNNLSKLNNIKTNPQNFLMLVPLLIDINNAYNENITFTTPFNSGKYPPLKSYNDNIKWILFSKDDSNYMYQIENHRLFKINENFKSGMEALMKNIEISDPNIFTKIKGILKKYE